MSIVVYRLLVLGLATLAVLAPLSLVVYQSFLTAPFFDHSAQFGLLAYSFVFADPDFWQAFWTTITIAGGMAVIAVPLGALLAFLMVRTDVPGRQYLEPLILIPISRMSRTSIFTVPRHYAALARISRKRPGYPAQIRSRLPST
jgi:iron(III) transport system permease protein